ncbi:MAG: TIGR00730 family Rossman fold protein [Faecalibacterium sp.]
MKICVYCSSAQGLDPEFYTAGEAFGRELARRGHTLVYGGYGEGVMGAVARGAAEGGAPVTAVVPAIFDREGFTAPGCTEVIHVRSMSQRKARMEAEADAFAVLPGGIGTLDEFFEVLVLKSLGQLQKPLGIYNVKGCYDSLAALLEQGCAQGMIRPANRALAPLFTDGCALLDALERG